MKTIDNKVDEDTCDKKVLVMTHQYVDLELMDSCLNCSGKDKYCNLYRPVKRTQQRYSHLNLYVRGE